MNNYLKLGLAAAVGVGAALLYKKLTCPCSHAASSAAVMATRPAAAAGDDDKDTGDGYANLSDVDDTVTDLPTMSTPCTSCNDNTGVVGPTSNLSTMPVIDVAPSRFDALRMARR